MGGENQFENFSFLLPLWNDIFYFLILVLVGESSCCDVCGGVHSCHDRLLFLKNDVISAPRLFDVGKKE